MENINSKSLADQIADYLSEKIIRFELRPGERIMESALSEKFQISRSPVREALRILERKQLVEIVPRKGARVTMLDKDYISSVFDILASLYSLAARKSIEKAGYEEIKIAEQGLALIKESALKNNTEEYFEKVFSFVKLGLLYTGNAILTKMLNDLLEVNKRIQFLVFRENMETPAENMNHFVNFTEALKNKDAKKGGRIIEEYVQNEKKKALIIIRKLNTAPKETGGN